MVSSRSQYKPITPEEWQSRVSGLKRTSHQLEGPCPHCGGTDRFHVNLAEPYLWGCRNCDDTGNRREIIKAVFPEFSEQRERKEPTLKTVYYHPDGTAIANIRYDFLPNECTWNKGDCKQKYVNHKHIYAADPETDRAISGKKYQGFLARIWQHPDSASDTDNENKPLVVVEGEKTAIAVNQAGFNAVTWLGGSPQASHADFAPLAGYNVIIWPDNDKPGKKAADTIAEKLDGVAKSIAIVNIPPNTPNGWDAADTTLEEIARLIGESSPYQPPAISSIALISGMPQVDIWYELGTEYAKLYLSKTHIYHPIPGKSGWWGYIDRRWQPLDTNDNTMMDDIIANRYIAAGAFSQANRNDFAEILTDNKNFGRNKVNNSSFWAGLRHALAGDIPEPASNVFATDNWIVNLDTGQMFAHAPEHHVRSISKGRYLPNIPDSQHWDVIHKRFDRVFSRNNQDEYIKLIALAITGMSQHYKSVVFINGPEGSGKGGAVNVIVNALGDGAISVDNNWLTRHNQSDIDATTADILISQPYAVGVDEIRSERNLVQNKLLSMSGNAPQRARRPHGQNLSGVLRCQLWTTCVEVPRFPANTGIKRRMAVLPTLLKIADSDKSPLGEHSQDLLDAIITLAIKNAADVYKSGYTPPEGDIEAKKSVISQMDELNDAIDGLDETIWEGRTVEELVEYLQKELGNEKISKQIVGRKLNSSDVWVAKLDRKKNSSSNGKKYLYRKPSEMKLENVETIMSTNVNDIENVRMNSGFGAHVNAPGPESQNSFLHRSNIVYTSDIKSSGPDRADENRMRECPKCSDVKILLKSGFCPVCDSTQIGENPGQEV